MQIMFFEGCCFVDQAQVRESNDSKNEMIHDKTRRTWLKLIAALIKKSGFDIKRRGVLDDILKHDEFNDENGNTIISRSALATILHEIKQVEK